MRSPIYMYIYISDMILYTRKLLILILVFNVCCVHLRSLRSLPDLPPLSYTQWVVGPKKTRDFAVDSSWSNHVRILCVFFLRKKSVIFCSDWFLKLPQIQVENHIWLNQKHQKRGSELNQKRWRPAAFEGSDLDDHDDSGTHSLVFGWTVRNEFTLPDLDHKL